VTEILLPPKENTQASQHFVNNPVKQYIVNSKGSKTMSDNGQVVLKCAFVQPKEES